jgi:glycosyltransferase involved in cell wall biosynthesis
VLEAFRCGSPLLASTQTSIPELTGEAACLVDGYSEEEIAAGLLALAQDVSLRDRLRSAGFERARIFSWEKTVEKAVSWIEENW